MHSIMLLSVVSLIAATGFSEASEDCPHYSSMTACERYRMPREFPLRRRQLDRACKLLLRNMACTEKYEEKCGYNDNQLKEIRKNMNITQRVCNNETALYRAVADNLKCIKKQIFEAPCSLHNEPELRRFENLLQENGVTVTATERYNKGHCADHLHSYGCKAAMVGLECSAEARDAVTEIYLNIIFPSIFCTDESVNKLPEIVKILEEDLLI